MALVGVKMIEAAMIMLGGVKDILGNFGFLAWIGKLGWDMLQFRFVSKKKWTWETVPGAIAVSGIMAYLAILMALTTNILFVSTRGVLGNIWGQMVEATSLMLGYEVMKKLTLREVGRQNKIALEKMEFVLSYFCYSLGGMLVYIMVTALIKLLVK